MCAVSGNDPAPLAEQTRRTYASKVRQYLAWLARAERDGDPLDSADRRDWAVRDYRTHLQAVLKRKPATVNSALAALDDFYIRRGLGAASTKRAEIPDARPARSTTSATSSLTARGSSASGQAGRSGSTQPTASYWTPAGPSGIQTARCGPKLVVPVKVSAVCEASWAASSTATSSVTASASSACAEECD